MYVMQELVFIDFHHLFEAFLNITNLKFWTKSVNFILLEIRKTTQNPKFGRVFEYSFLSLNLVTFYNLNGYSRRTYL